MRWLCFAIVLLAAPARAQSVPVIPYESVPNAVRLPPNMYLGEVAGVAVNSKKHVFVYSRGNTTGPAFGASASQLLEIPAIGRELQKLRCRCAKSRTARVAARIDKNVFFRVHGHAGDFTQIHIRRQAHGIGHRLIWNHGHGLGAHRRRQQDNCKAQPTHHNSLLLFGSNRRRRNQGILASLERENVTYLRSRHQGFCPSPGTAPPQSSLMKPLFSKFSTKTLS